VSGRPVRGQIVEVDLDPVVGHEQERNRPCVVVQNDLGNRFSSMMIVHPLTDAAHIGGPSPIYVPVQNGDGGIRKDSIVLCDQIRAVDHLRLSRAFGILSPETMRRVDWALLISLGLARGRKP
jgi:mRNA interferase MazF